MKTLQQIINDIDAIPGESIWVKRMVYFQPKTVLELGTGQGATACVIVSVLPADAKFFTVNYDYPSFDEFGEMLNKCTYVCQMSRINGDTLDPKTLDKVPDGVDFMFIDTDHYSWQAGAELELWQKKLQDGAIVIADDLGMNDMHLFWDSIPYDKMPQNTGALQGYFRYDKSHPYVNSFHRGRTPKEIALG